MENRAKTMQQQRQHQGAKPPQDTETTQTRKHHSGKTGQAPPLERRRRTAMGGAGTGRSNEDEKANPPRIGLSCCTRIVDSLSLEKKIHGS
jgi:hypothetical protein